MSSKNSSEKDQYSPSEARNRFEAALRGARIVGHKSQSEMKLGKSKAKSIPNEKVKKPTD